MMSRDYSYAHRFAVYFAPPPGSLWWDAGSQWLGRCAATDSPLARPPIAGISPELQQQLTAEPQRYIRFSTANSMSQLKEAVARLEAKAAGQEL